MPEDLESNGAWTPVDFAEALRKLDHWHRRWAAQELPKLERFADVSPLEGAASGNVLRVPVFGTDIPTPVPRKNAQGDTELGPCPPGSQLFLLEGVPWILTPETPPMLLEDYLEQQAKD